MKLENLDFKKLTFRPEHQKIIKPLIKATGLNEVDFIEKIHTGLDIKKPFSKLDQDFFLALFDNKLLVGGYVACMTYAWMTISPMLAITLFAAGSLGYGRAVYMEKLERETKQQLPTINQNATPTSKLHRPQFVSSKT